MQRYKQVTGQKFDGATDPVHRYRADALFFIMGDFKGAGWGHSRFEWAKKFGLSRAADHLPRARSLNASAKEFGFYLP